MSNGYDKNTNALSVYNALSITGRDMTADECIAFLRQSWNAGFDGSDLAEGLSLLKSMRVVAVDGDTLRIPKRDMRTRRGPRLMRKRPGDPLYVVRVP